MVAHSGTPVGLRDLFPTEQASRACRPSRRHRRGIAGNAQAGVTHHVLHSSRQVRSRFRAKRGASVNGEDAICLRRLPRNFPSRGRSAARAHAIFTSSSAVRAIHSGRTRFISTLATIREQCDSPGSVTTDRRRSPPRGSHRAERLAKIRVIRRDARRQRDGLRDHPHREIAAPGLMRDHAPQMLRCHGGDLPLQRLRLRQPPALVMLHRNL